MCGASTGSAIGRLVTGKESYLYDAHGRRVQITKTSDSKINYPLYSLDGKLLLEDNRQTLTRTEYIYAGGRLVAKKIQPITSTGANTGVVTTTTIHTDFLGSPVAETNATGAVNKVERFTPYGEASDLVLDAGPGFTGHATDVATGLTYMQQRYYDAEIGRFLVPDPVQTNPNSGGSFNRYWYADNNPVANVDPDGQKGVNLFSSIPSENDADDPVFNNITKVLVDSNTGMYFAGGHSYGNQIMDRSVISNDGKGLPDYHSKDTIMGRLNGLESNQPVLFAVCNLGISSDIPQSVADQNNSNVFAPNGFVSYQSNGIKATLTVWTGTGRTGAQGEFLKFTPGGNGTSMGIKSIEVNMKTGDIKLNYKYPKSVMETNIKKMSEIIKKKE